METPSADPGATPVGPTLGDVRFSGTGSLETFDGTDWVPLERLSDVGAPPVFRHEHLVQPSTRNGVDDADDPTTS